MKSSSNPARLSPLPVRIIAYLVLAAIALASIWLIDSRAMQRQAELQSQPIPAPQTPII